MNNISQLFETAINSSLKYPKITVVDPQAGTVVFKRAGSKSKYNGQVMITDDRAFGDNSYFGRIDPSSGQLTNGRDMNQAVRNLITRFEADPIGTAKASARLTGRCMFCDLPLNDARSTANGYGPVCAKKYHLPWDAAKESKHGIRYACTNAVLNPVADVKPLETNYNPNWQAEARRLSDASRAAHTNFPAPTATVIESPAPSPANLQAHIDALFS